MASPNTTQPDATPSPSITEAAPVRTSSRKPSVSRRLKYVMRGVASGIGDLLLLLWIGVAYVIPGGIAIVVLFGLILGLSLGFTAAYGAIFMLIGNAILRAHLAHYTSNASAAAIGATGGVLASIIVGIATSCIPLEEGHPALRFMAIPATVLVSTVTGAIGSSILLSRHVDLGIDVLHATRAGALGGTIVSLGSPLLVPVIAIAVAILFSPLWAAMAMGLRWVHVRSSESWDGRTHRSSSCYCYGTCGDDPEIEEELAQIPKGSRHFYLDS
ncbi:hypothetical protein GALMADRAFT_246177 [Galerina marginata CBS 339.88]|uniref:Uncharacterized protein n=1 Tax=Galerina marginata (strain CBS 339.88) TaxID=685588 RepID=A0A067TAU8_GALM3|nr:hypothetical protein GALMADRAFT_246177 [Galerina marginata CBS 339.88]